MDHSSESITRSVDTVLSIYQGSSSTMKNRTGKTSQELKETLDQLIKYVDRPTPSTSMPSHEHQCDQIATLATVLPTPMPVPTPMPAVPTSMETPAPTTPTSVNHQDDSSNRNFSEYPLQFDTRTQIIPLQQIIEDSPFFSFDLNKVQENVLHQSNEPNQYLPTITVVNSSRSTIP